MPALSPKTPGQHISVFAAIEAREEKIVQQLTATTENFTNSFLVSSDSTPYTDLNILVTKLVMSEETKNDMPQQSEIGRKLFHTFVDDRRRKSGKVHNEEAKTSDLENKWQGLKVIKVKAADNILELKEDKSLFARLMMVCKSRPEVEIQETVGVYEFSADYCMLYCSCKGALMHKFEKLSKGEFTRGVTPDADTCMSKLPW